MCVSVCACFKANGGVWESCCLHAPFLVFSKHLFAHDAGLDDPPMVQSSRPLLTLLFYIIIDTLQEVVT